MEGAEFPSARSAWLRVSAFMEKVQRTRGIERTGQDKIAEVRRGRMTRRGIPRDPRGSEFPRSEN